MTVTDQSGRSPFNALQDQLNRPLVAKRRVFVSYHHGDEAEARAFVNAFGGPHGVFTHRGIGLTFNDDIIKSTDPEYVMRRIREIYLQDSTVTIVLIGTCTHSRRYVDWEIKASLRQGLVTPNGLIGIILPSAYRPNLPGIPVFPIVPDRFYTNFGLPGNLYQSEC
jgi:hypothetical protein